MCVALEMMLFIIFYVYVCAHKAKYNCFIAPFFLVGIPLHGFDERRICRKTIEMGHFSLWDPLAFKASVYFHLSTNDNYYKSSVIIHVLALDT